MIPLQTLMKYLLCGSSICASPPTVITWGTENETQDKLTRCSHLDNQPGLRLKDVDFEMQQVILTHVPVQDVYRTRQ